MHHPRCYGISPAIVGAPTWGRLDGSPRAATQGRPYKNIIHNFELRDSLREKTIGYSFAIGRN
jgi:hypothetical protein